MDEPGIDILHRILATRDGFGHREHLELAWSCLRRYDIDAAHEAVATAVRHLAQGHGMPDRYHETLTRSWVHVVALHRALDPGESFDAFIAAHPVLLTRDLLSRHYSQPLLHSATARADWAEPDLRAFPALA
ncbi:MAG: hypothetical protein WAU75_25065 [Solirubrobacteraceae bacterium]